MDWIVLGIPVGIVLLYFGSDWLVKGAKNLALRLGIAPFVVGLTIIAFGSSAPELVTSVVSTGTPEIIMGNVLGSNIVNIGIAIGLAALICPMVAEYRSMKLEISAMLILAFIVFAMALTGTVGRIFGIVLLVILALFLFLVYRGKKDDVSAQKSYVSETEDESAHGYPVLVALIAVGLVLLYFGAKWFVEGATELAYEIGLSELFVGLIIVAIGTSLPEICICIIAAKKGENELAVSNIVGSNVFNAAAVLGLGAVLVDIPVSDAVVCFHLPAMVLLSVFMFVMVRTKNGIGRRSAALLMGVYAVYTAVLFAVPSLSG